MEKEDRGWWVVKKGVVPSPEKGFPAKFEYWVPSVSDTQAWTHTPTDTTLPKGQISIRETQPD